MCSKKSASFDVAQRNAPAEAVLQQEALDVASSDGMRTSTEDDNHELEASEARCAEGLVHFMTEAQSEDDAIEKMHITRNV
jgi:hypothetical protein